MNSTWTEGGFWLDKKPRPINSICTSGPCFSRVARSPCWKRWAHRAVYLTEGLHIEKDKLIKQVPLEESLLGPSQAKPFTQTPLSAVTMHWTTCVLPAPSLIQGKCVLCSHSTLGFLLENLHLPHLASNLNLIYSLLLSNLASISLR